MATDKESSHELLYTAVNSLSASVQKDLSNYPMLAAPTPVEAMTHGEAWAMAGAINAMFVGPEMLAVFRKVPGVDVTLAAAVDKLQLQMTNSYREAEGIYGEVDAMNRGGAKH